MILDDLKLCLASNKVSNIRIYGYCTTKMDASQCIGVLLVVLNLTWNISGHIAEEMECPDKLHPGIFSTDYWVLPGVPYRAWRTLPWRYFSIRQSIIPQAGMGVFADRFIPAHTWLGEYEGEMLNMAQSEEVQDFLYTWRVYTDDEVTHFVDALPEHLSNWLRFINCPRHVSEENVIMHTCYGAVWYRTKKDLHPGQEMFVYYGDNYFEDNLSGNSEDYYNETYVPPFKRLREEKVKNLLNFKYHIPHPAT